MSMQRLTLPAGTSLLLGSPANPMEEERSRAIGKLTDSIEGILEAHLPQMFAIGVMEEPAQVLVIVLGQHAILEEISEQLKVGLAGLLPRGVHLDVWPIHSGHEMLDDVRQTGCLI